MQHKDKLLFSPFVCLLAMFLLSGCLPGTRITGQIMDSETGKPLRRAQVEIDWRSTTTDWDGRFSLNMTGGEEKRIYINKNFQELNSSNNLEGVYGVNYRERKNRYIPNYSHEMDTIWVTPDFRVEITKHDGRYIKGYIKNNLDKEASPRVDIKLYDNRDQRLNGDFETKRINIDPRERFSIEHTYQKDITPAYVVFEIYDYNSDRNW